MGDTKATDGMFYVVTFGGLRVYRVGDRVGEKKPFLSRLATKKTESLFAFLAINAGKMFPRATLAEMFWPEKTSTHHGLQNLSQSLSFLRKHLKVPGLPLDDLLQANYEAVGLTTAFTTDVAENAALIKSAHRNAATAPEQAAARYRQAAGMYAAGFLPDLKDEWVHAAQRDFANAYDQIHTWLAHYSILNGQVVPLKVEMPALAGRRTRSNKNERSNSQNREYKPSTVPGAPVLTANSLPNGPDFPFQPFPSLPSVSHSELPTEAIPQPPIPNTRTAFFGRKTEMAILFDYLQSKQSAVITVTGLGGVGKTRLVREVGQLLREDAAPGRSLFVDLSQVDTVAELTATVLTVLGKPTAVTGEAAMEQILSALQQISNPILLLDNFDRVIEDGAAWIQSLVLRSRHLKVLITSRTRLNIEDEQVLPLCPLPVPTVAEAQGSVDVDALIERWPALAMYQARAQAAAPSFQISARAVGEIALLLHVLDGIPLAIELAAARARAMGTSLMLDQLGTNRFGVLRYNGHKVEERHRSLHDTISWSINRLNKGARRTLAQLSVFPGSFSQRAAMAITGHDAVVMSDLVRELADSSLLMVEELYATPEGKLESRFSLLDTIREYARELLEPKGAAEARRRHAQYYLELAKGAAKHLFHAEQEQWLRYLRDEYPNLQAALNWHAAQPDQTKENLELCVALSRLWYVCGPMQEGRRYLESAIEAVQNGQGLVTAKELISALIAASALVTETQDMDVARRYLRQVQELTGPGGPAAGDRRRAMMLHNLAGVEADAGDYTRATELQNEAIAYWEAEGRTFALPDAWGNLGDFAYRAGDWAEAKRTLDISLSLAKELQNQQAAGTALELLGDIARESASPKEAEGLYRQALVSFAAVEDDLSCANVLVRLAFNAQDQGSVLRAAWLGRVVTHIAATLRVPFQAAVQQRRSLLPLLPDTDKIPYLSFRDVVDYVIAETESGVPRINGGH